MPKKLTVLPTPSASEGQPWYAGGLAFSCTCSGNCCTGGPGFVWISDEEIDRLAAHLALTREETLRTYCRKIGRQYSLKEKRTPQGGYDCIFLTEVPAEKRKGEGVALRKRVCGIYAARPLQCRTWPFWDGNLLSKADWDHASKRCPGMDRGRTFTAGQIESIRGAADWPKDPPTSDKAK